MRSGNSLVRTRAAALWKSVPSVLPLALTLSISTLITSSGFAAQTASSSASQAGINEEAQAAYRAGTAAAANNDFNAAEAQFEKVVRLVPQIEEGHSALGAVLMRLGKLPEAIKELEKAHQLKPGDPSVQTNLALAYEQTGANQKALVLFRDIEVAQQRKPGSNSASVLPSYVLAAYARSLAATGQLPAATAKMKAAVAESPQSADLHDALGSLYAQQRSWPLAVSEFQKVIQLNPKSPSAHLHLGAGLLAQQQAPAAIQELSVAVQLSPENPLAATELGKAYAANTEDDKAICGIPTRHQPRSRVRRSQVSTGSRPAANRPRS